MNDYQRQMSRLAADRTIQSLMGCLLSKEDVLRIAEVLLMCVDPFDIKELSSDIKRLSGGEK
jgi:hypothetical protein